MTLVDTSYWVDALRRNGDAQRREELRNLVHSGQAAWCPVVRLELWAGVGADPERQVLKHYEQIIPELSIDDQVWQEACDLAERGRRQGITVPRMDLIIAACARHHKVPLLAHDAHFEQLMKL